MSVFIVFLLLPQGMKQGRQTPAVAGILTCIRNDCAISLVVDYRGWYIPLSGSRNGSLGPDTEGLTSGVMISPE
jgi:hypothetical protein